MYSILVHQNFCRGIFFFRFFSDDKIFSDRYFVFYLSFRIAICINCVNFRALTTIGFSTQNCPYQEEQMLYSICRAVLWQLLRTYCTLGTLGNFHAKLFMPHKIVNCAPYPASKNHQPGDGGLENFWLGKKVRPNERPIAEREGTVRVGGRATQRHPHTCTGGQEWIILFCKASS